LREQADPPVVLDDPDSREALAVFLMRLRRAGVRDLAVLRAIEATPRHLFVAQRYRDLAFRELNLPLPCGQTMPDAFFVARLAEAARCGAVMRLLEIGAGSGYATAVFARLCAEVIAVERYRTLVVEANARLESLRCANARVHWGDGAALPAALGRFDRIVVHAGATPAQIADFRRLLEPGGLMLAGETGADGATRVMRYDANPAAAPEALFPARLRPLAAGLARAL
jgi:protein-L-isoaspartate(D-aspartate) O-methyltransferase